MKKWKKLFAVFAALFIALPVSAQISGDSLTIKINQLLEDATNKGIFSGIVVVSQNGRIIYKKREGYADWQTKRPLTDETLYNIGSLNKQFTEEMIRQLVTENKLAYADPLSKYLDIYPPETGNKITIQELLDMRAGLGDYFGSLEFHQIERTDFQLSDILKIIKQEPLLFEPGTSQQYSNSGYAVLGAVIEKITGKSYEDNLRERIVLPLKLRHIYYTKAEKAAQVNRAYGHITDLDGNKITSDDLSNAQPAGGIYTDVYDLLTFAEAKGSGLLPSGYNYRLPAGFAGGTPPWNSMISFGNNNGITYVIMCNIGQSADQIGRRIGSILKGENYPPLSFPFVVTLYKTVSEKGIEFIDQHIRELCEQDHKPYNDQFLNFYGYQVLQNGKTGTAIELFKLNAKLFPDVPNVYDSLGEAYLLKGDKENARENYRKVLELDPANQHVRDIIKRMDVN